MGRDVNMRVIHGQTAREWIVDDDGPRVAPFRQRLDEAHRVISSLTEHERSVERIAQVLVRALRGGKKVMACGNGGSSALASHFVGELVGRFHETRVALPAVHLGGDATQMACIANDFDWNEVFSRPLEAFGKKGDVLFVFSTSGNSPNVVNALKKAKELGVTSVAFLGKDGGPCRGLATHEVIVKSNDTPRVQEAHELMMHWLCEHVDEAFPKRR
jgi:D-sedoheptulose 7-phosphate isomerase